MHSGFIPWKSPKFHWLFLTQRALSMPERTIQTSPPALPLNGHIAQPGLHRRRGEVCRHLSLPYRLSIPSWSPEAIAVSLQISTHTGFSSSRQLS